MIYSDDSMNSASEPEPIVTIAFIRSRKVERCVVTLSGPRALLLVGEPGTAKSMISELLAAAISGTSERTVQGSAGTDEPQLRYGWNYAMLVAEGPSPEALARWRILRRWPRSSRR